VGVAEPLVPLVEVVVLVVDVEPPADPALEPLPAAGGDEPVSTRYTPELSRGAEPGTR
jgi:hypothetical protein